MSQNQTESKPQDVEEPCEEGLDGTPCSASWMPIESAPITDHGYFFARIAWGPDHDKSTGDGMRYKGEWFAACLFYQNRSHDQRQYVFEERKVTPTHWKLHELFQPNNELKLWDTIL